MVMIRLVEKKQYTINHTSQLVVVQSNSGVTDPPQSLQVKVDGLQPGPPSPAPSASSQPLGHASLSPFPALAFAPDSLQCVLLVALHTPPLTSMFDIFMPRLQMSLKQR